MNNLLGSNDVVYLLQYNNEGIYKIGRTSNLLQRASRIDVLMPHSVKLVYWIHTDDSKRLEAYWHKKFASKRRPGSGVKKPSEWFDLRPEDVKEFQEQENILETIENFEHNALDFEDTKLREQAIRRVIAYYENLISQHPQLTTKLINSCIWEADQLNTTILRLAKKQKPEEETIKYWEQEAYKAADKEVIKVQAITPREDTQGTLFNSP